MADSPANCILFPGRLGSVRPNWHSDLSDLFVAIAPEGGGGRGIGTIGEYNTSGKTVNPRLIRSLNSQRF
jgi:hypothetical protein